MNEERKRTGPFEAKPATNIESEFREPAPTAPEIGGQMAELFELITEDYDIPPEAGDELSARQAEIAKAVDAYLDGRGPGDQRDVQSAKTDGVLRRRSP